MNTSKFAQIAGGATDNDESLTFRLSVTSVKLTPFPLSLTIYPVKSRGMNDNKIDSPNNIIIGISAERPSFRASSCPRRAYRATTNAAELPYSARNIQVLGKINGIVLIYYTNYPNTVLLYQYFRCPVTRALTEYFSQTVNFTVN